MRRWHFSLAGLIGFVFVVALGLVSLRDASGVWSRVTLLLTLGVLSLAILGVVYRRGARQAFWLGFAWFGWGYMVLASGFWWDRTAVEDRRDLVTTMLLVRLYPAAQLDRFARFPGEPDPRDLLIQAKLDERISMSFGNETSLEDVLKYLRAATIGRFDSGIPFYVDPSGLQRANQSMSSVVTLDMEGVPLRTTLKIMLKQLGLAYEVHDGLLTIIDAPSSKLGLIDSEPLSPPLALVLSESQASYLLTGHCYFGLLAALIGGAGGRYFFRTRDGLAGG